MEQNKNSLNPFSKNLGKIFLWTITTINLLAVIFFGLNLKVHYNKYKIYVGTNDKDTNTQLIPKEDVIRIVEDVCLERLGEYTLQDAYGFLKDDSGKSVSEYTLVCIFNNTDEETVHKIAGELVKRLNRYWVLIESSSVKTEYYGGN